MKQLIGYMVIFVVLNACNAGSGRNTDVQVRNYTMAPLTTNTASEATPTTDSSIQLPAGKPSWMLPQTVSLPTDPASASGRKNPPHGQPGHQCGVPVGAPLGGTPAAILPQPSAGVLPAGNARITPVNLPATSTSVLPQGAAAPAKNPPHGQPGHRCDLAVGAPLTGAPTTQPATQPTASTTTTKKPAATTAPGMNPSHGQPGHRCDIAVGAPLNSPAADKTPATIIPATTTPAPAAQPQTVSPLLPSGNAGTPATPAVAGTPRLNPAHGQPGHDCSVKVGEPLKQ